MLSILNSTELPVAEGQLPRSNVCFKVTAVRCAIPGCCDMDLHTIKMLVDNKCESKLEEVQVNGAVHDWRWAVNRKNRHLTLNVPSIDLSVQEVAPSGVTVCMQLVSPCNILSNFCITGICKYAIFNLQSNCCPIGDIRLPPAERH